MVGNEIVPKMEEQQKVEADDSDHIRDLADLKSKFSWLEIEVGSESSSPSSVKLQCPMVPNRLRPDVKDAEHSNFAPKLISLGPYHHGEPHLKGGEKIKLKLAKEYVKN